jgi:hypothetical protein
MLSGITRRREEEEEDTTALTSFEEDVTGCSPLG